MDSIPHLGPNLEPNRAEPLPNRLRFFRRFPSSNYKTRVVAYPFHEPVQYALDFEVAASALASTLVGKPEDDRLLLPVLHLYRHAFELRLKVMLAHLDITPSANGGQGLDAPKRRDGHELKNLVTEYVHKAGELLGGPFPEDLKKIIYELHDLDPGGMSFRYADSSRVSVPAYIDLPEMAKCLDNALSTLASVQDYVEDHAGWNSRDIWGEATSDSGE